MSASPDNNHTGRTASSNGSTNTTLSSGIFPEKGKPGITNHLPQRYAVKTNDDERVLTCLEAPNLSVHIEAGLSVSGSVARKSPRGTIFLDGVAQCEPLMDHERQVYNLDHHEGCVRAFTLASCEQALVMYMKGLDLRGRDWNIFANEPDLDTILAIWIILNHARIGPRGTTQRRILFALVRYEGIIDALGLELRELAALPPELMRKIQRVIDHLRSDELALKKEGRWADTDYLSYTASILHKIDQIFYKASDFQDYQGVKELARIDLTDQRIAVVVEAEMGIYEIEPHLNKLYGQRLGVVFLKKGPSTYTVRQMDLFMPITLDDVYDRLNFVDAAVKCRTQSNKWGGSADIGGSPRETGTQLSPHAIAQTCREAVNKPMIGQKLYRLAVSAALIGFIFLCAHVVRLHWYPDLWLGRDITEGLWTTPVFAFIATLILASGISSIFIAYCRPWQYGWAGPVGKQWWLLLPAVLLGGAAGGVWAPADLAHGESWEALLLLGAIGMPLAAEMLFRSLTHGMLAQNARIQRHDTRWFFSWPNVGSTLLYLGFILLLYYNYSPNTLLQTFGLGNGVTAAIGAGLFGLSMGMIRERSQSIWPTLFFHMLTAAAALLLIRLL